MALRFESTISGKKITIHSSNGQMFVNGRDTQLYQWKSDPKRWKNQGGSDISELKGKSIEEVLKYKGHI